MVNIYQLLDEVEQNIVICEWRADQLFVDAEGRGKSLICETLTNHDILRKPSSIIVLSFTYTASFYVFCVFFLQVSETTHLPKVQQSGRHCMFTKIEGNAHAQTIICS